MAQPEPPEAPIHVHGYEDDGAALVQWEPAEPNGAPVTGYAVTAAPGDHVAEVPAAPTSYFLRGLTNGTEYRFCVTAHSAVGDGPTATSRFMTIPSPEDDDPRAENAQPS